MFEKAVRHWIIWANIPCQCAAPAPLGLGAAPSPAKRTRAHLGRWTGRIPAGLHFGTELSLPSRAPRYFLDIFSITKLKETNKQTNKQAERVRGCRTRVPAERRPPLRLPLGRVSAPAGARHGRAAAFPGTPLPGPAAPSRPGIGAGARGRRGAGRRCQADSAPLRPASPGGGTAPGRAPAPRPGPPRPARTAMI